jgi:hypothetical protein
MGQVKTIRSRIQFKMDTLKNWENFIPQKGELCICSEFIDTGLENKQGNKIYQPGLKIGIDGTTPFKSLPFVSEEYITNESILRLFNSENTTNILDEAYLDSIILD